jgi:hypothetical protein
MDVLRKTTALALVLLATKRDEHECTLMVEICNKDEIDMGALDASHVILLQFTSQAHKQTYGFVVKNSVLDDALITFCKKVEAGDFAYNEIEMFGKLRGRRCPVNCFIRYFRGLFTIIQRNNAPREFIVPQREMLKLVDVVLHNPPLLT